MLCQECLKRNATVLINTNINGNQKTIHLCNQCAAKLGLSPFGGMGNMLSAFLNNNDVLQTRKSLVCPECGYQLEQMNQAGFLGCDKCYESFAEQLLPVIKRIQGSVTHKPEISPQEAQPDRIEQLKKELKEAIDQEEYERAAQLRDSIKEIEKGEKA